MRETERHDGDTDIFAAGDHFAARTRPPGADRYAVWWKVWLPIPLMLLLLDVTFNLWFWQIPKLTGSAADYSYQFLYDLAHLRDSKPDGTARVVAFGSSVSSAFDPWQVQSLVEAKLPSKPVEIRRLTKPGSKPSDHQLVWRAERDAIDPDVAVLIVNLVDFLNPSFERSLKADIRYVLPPWRTLVERWNYIPTISEKLQLVVAGISNMYRYRKPIQSAVEDNGRAMLRWVTNRGGGAGYGWYPDGYTHERFGIPISGDAKTFEYYVHPAWIAQRGTVHLHFTLDNAPFAEREEREAGWKTLDLDGHTGMLGVTADSVWNPRAAGLGNDLRLLGVRMRDIPPDSMNHGRPPFRYALRDPSEPDEFLRMGDAVGDEYAQKWRATLEEDSEFARRFRAYRDVKMALRGRRFEPVGEFAAVKNLVKELTDAGVRVVIVNTPESSLLEGLASSEYYHDYLEFFLSLTRDNTMVRFIDLHASLPPEDLNDWHHVNYVGQIRLGPVFAEVIAEELGGGRKQDGDHAL